MRKAFTLVELLVVISIIALLVSILLPALNKAREQAKFVVCKSQMRQNGIAMLTYSDTNDGRLPPGDHVDGMVIIKHAHQNVPSGSVNQGHLLEDGYVPLPTETEFLFWCPSAQTKADQINPLSGLSYFSREEFMRNWDRRFNLPNDARSTTFSLYDYRDSMDGPSDKLENGVRSEKVSQHSIMMDVARLNPDGGGYHPSTKTGSKYNILMGDGSVQVFDDPLNDKLSPVFSSQYDLLIRKPRFQHSSYDFAASGWRDHEFFDVIDQHFGLPMFQPPIP